MTQQWLQIHVTANDQEAETLSNHLTELGALAVTMAPAQDTPVFQHEPGETPLWNQLILSVLFPVDADPDIIRGLLLSHQIISENSGWKSEILTEKNWVHETQKAFPAKCFANKLWVVPGWEENDYPEPKLILDPGLAFGTGTHPTTSLCLEWLAQNWPTGKTVIDYGCGSGILSLAACVLGASQIYAIDHDEQAVLATEQNTDLNPGAKEKMVIGLQDALPQSVQADLVIANILAKPLLSLYPVLLHHTKPGGQLILSGLLESDKAAIVDCYSQDFTLIECKQQDEWLRLEFLRAM